VHDPVTGLPPGTRVAFDRLRGRLWTICDGCERWTLAPMEDRATALDALEREARDRATHVSATANISLLASDRMLLVRVGEAPLGERAWWRYGHELRERRQVFSSRGAKVSAMAYGAVAYVGEVTGVLDPGLHITWDDEPMADILRWRRHGWTAWWGRVRCPHCRSVLRALPFDLSWWLYPRMEADALVVGVPCGRCDPWSPDKCYPIEGDDALLVLRRALAYQHVTGAPERLIQRAVREIEHAGSTTTFTAGAATGRTSLWSMAPTRRLALEIAVGETADGADDTSDVRALDATWRHEESLARIVDEELSAPGDHQQLLRRMHQRAEAV
jgi:hypothetical protein